MTTASAQHRYVGVDGGAVTAAQFDGRVAGFAALLAVFPGRVRPHPHRDDALLVTVGGERAIRIIAGDWVVADAEGRLSTEPEDAFRLRYAHPEPSLAAA